MSRLGSDVSIIPSFLKGMFSSPPAYSSSAAAETEFLLELCHLLNEEALLRILCKFFQVPFRFQIEAKNTL